MRNGWGLDMLLKKPIGFAGGLWIEWCFCVCLGVGRDREREGERELRRTPRVLSEKVGRWLSAVRCPLPFADGAVAGRGGGGASRAVASLPGCLHGRLPVGISSQPLRRSDVTMGHAS